MASIRRVGELEIGQDLAFQRRAWAVQRVAWVIMGLLVLAALAGLCGPGPLSSAQASDASGLVRAEYQRFERHESPTTLRIHLGPGASREGEVRLWLGRDYMDALQVQHITPEPSEVSADVGRLVYTFRVAPGESLAPITFHLQTEGFGPLDGQLGLVDGETVRFWQFVFP